MKFAATDIALRPGLGPWLSLFLLGLQPAHGQVPGPGAGTTLPPVSVTATRVETPIFDVPASVDLVGAETIKAGHALVNISEDLNSVAGVQARDRQNYAQDVQISIRGFGARSTFGLRGLRVYVDGIPATFPDGQGQITNVELGSTDRIEVLRGPYSALYGNSSGGVISTFSEDGAARPTLDFSLASGSHGLVRLGTKLSGRAGEGSGNLGYVLGVSHFQTDGYRDHSAAGRNLGNAKLTYRLDDATKLTLIANAVSLPRAQDPLGLSRAELASDPRAVDPSALQFNTRKTTSQTQAGLIYEHRFDGANTLRALLYDGHRDTEQYQSIPVATQAPVTNPGGVIDLSSDYHGTDLRWTHLGTIGSASYSVVGGIAYDTLGQHRLGYLNYVGTGAAQVTGVKGALRRDENDAAFNLDEYVQAELRLSRRWSVSAGLRHSDVAIESKDHFIVAGNGDDSGSTRYSATLPVLGVMYAASDAVHVYATAGQGFETPTLNELAYQPSGAPGLDFGLQPARSDSVEIGLKTRFDDLGALNLALFDTTTRHEIVTLSSVGGRSTYQNAGTTRRTGVEVGWSRTFKENLQARASLSILDASYTSTFTTCNVTPCAASAQQPIPSGNFLPGVARTTAALALAWTPPIGWQGGADARYSGRVFVNDANSDAASAYAVFGAYTGYGAILGRWKLSGLLRCDNLLNRRYVGSVIVNESNGRFFEPALDRTFLASLSATYAF